MPERRENIYLRDRLEEIQEGYERWTKYTVRLLAILFMIQLGLGALSVFLVTQNAHRSNQVRTLVAQQQVSREQAVRSTCLEQNRRHDSTISTIDQVITQLPPGLQRDRALRNRAGTVLIIDALAPKRDCEKRVRELAPRPGATNVKRR